MDEAQTITAGDWSAQKSTLREAAPVRQATPGERLLEQMDQKVAASFTDIQVREVERILSMPSSRRFPVDIRVSLPFVWRRYFITILAGPEQRSAERLEKERADHALWTFTNIVAIIFLLLMFVPALIGLIHILTFAG